MVCHLVDSEQAWCHRMKRVIAEERPLLIGYDESRFTASLAYHQHDLHEELDAARRHAAADGPNPRRASLKRPGLARACTANED